MPIIAPSRSTRYGPASAHDARYFPQPLTSFTLGALAVFYLSLNLSVLAMVAQPGMAAVATNLRGTIVLVAVIVIATLPYVGIFHFVPGAQSARVSVRLAGLARPGQRAVMIRERRWERNEDRDRSRAA
jgi:hypothetical protein